MDKIFAFAVVGFFIVCSAIITWTAFKGPKRSKSCEMFTYGYAAVLWLCVISLAVLTFLYW